MSRRLLLLIALVLLACISAEAVPPTGESKPVSGNPDAGRALAQVQVAKGLTVEVWAAEPLLANPVAFSFDGKGRCFIAETTRFAKGVPDTRNHMYWLDDDLACRTVADRLAMYTRDYPGHKPYTGFEKYADQVRLVWDESGSGHATKSSIFSGGYNRPEDGLAAGVLARKDGVYFTCIPDLYLLKDTKGTGVADEKKSLSTGYGVRAQFLGHDLHGLRMGPDGLLYFTIGDRGLNVVDAGGKSVVNTDSGCVMRCERDGTRLEIVHKGLRNPQELAFDDFGNLFTFDNNSDSGDRARWVYVVEGGDSGWRCGYQFGSEFHPPGVPQGNRGPWNAEKIWHVPGQESSPPAYVTPPLAHFGDGPSGITHYPGLGLADRYQDHFFCCDFSSTPSSKIWSLAVKPKGASFEITDLHPFVRGMVPTDCDFGPDGAFYWSDWVGGWDPPNKGRIFKLTDPEAMKNPAVADAQKLLAEGFEKKTVPELCQLLGHPHQQVRLEAQYELAGKKAVEPLVRVAGYSQIRLSRIHAVWALGMIARTDLAVVKHLVSLLDDPDVELRVQSLKALRAAESLQGKTLKDISALAPDLAGHLIQALTDQNPRVRYHALLMFPLLRDAEQGHGGSCMKRILQSATENADRDLYLRHACVQALCGCKFQSLFQTWLGMKAEFDKPSARMCVVLAMRQLKDPSLAEFLTDPDAAISMEAARAIYDERIDGAMARLAAQADRRGSPDPVVYRALGACFRLGTPADAARVAAFAARSSEPEHTRKFALRLLSDWAKPPRRDPVTGMAVTIPARPGDTAAAALRPLLKEVFTGSDSLRKQAAQVSARLGIKEVGPMMAKLVRDASQPAGVRVEALYALAAVKDPALTDVAAAAIASGDPLVRTAGRAVKARSAADEVVGTLPRLLDDPAVPAVEKQGAFAILAEVGESPAVDNLLGKWLDALDAGKVGLELVLDILDAADHRSDVPGLKLHAPLREKVDQYRATQARQADPLAPYAEAIAGGNADKGRGVFLNNSAVYCQRCHRLDGQGGDVGPQLNGIAAELGKDRRYLLESVVFPNAKIAKGYETVVLALADGRTVSGVLKSADAKSLRLMTADAKEIVIPVDDIESRRTGPSAMPADLHKKLSRRELRDVIEFLASLKTPPPKPSP